MLMVSAFESRLPYCGLIIGLAAIGTILCGKVQKLRYPKFGGILGGCIATVFQLKLRPLDRPFGIVFWIANIGLAIAVSVVVVHVFDMLSCKDDKNSM